MYVLAWNKHLCPVLTAEQSRQLSLGVAEHATQPYTPLWQRQDYAPLAENAAAGTEAVRG